MIIRNLLAFSMFTLGTVTGTAITVDTAQAACEDSAAPGVNWEKCRKRNLIMSSTDFTNANMQDADFSSTDLRDTTLDGTNFTKANLLRASLADSSAKGAIFDRVVAFRADFSSMDLSNASFVKSEVYRSNFSEANLENVDFSKSELARVDFSNANLAGVNLEFSNLARANFQGASATHKLPLKGSYMYQTRIEGVDLSQATGLEYWQIEMACGDDDTKLPKNVSRPSNWPCTE